jgi:hypothetical protein
MQLHRVACLVVAAGVLLTACGTPERVHTVDDTRDFGGTPILLTHALPNGLSAVGVDGPRLLAGCNALQPRVATLITGHAPVFTGRHCEWNGIDGPAVIVGMIEHTGASFTLDETRTFIDHERTISGVGQRAVYDTESHALYIIISNRLWYVQLVGSAAANPSALPTLVSLGRALARTPAVQ